MGELVKVKAGGPLTAATPRMEHLDTQFRVIREMLQPLIDFDFYEPRSQEVCERVLPRAKELVRSDEFLSLRADLEKAQEPATKKEIADEIAKLLVAWPNTAKADLRGFGALLSADVSSKTPSRYALQEACRYLRQKHKFLPTISEVLETIECKDGALAYNLGRIADYARLPFEVAAAIERRKAEHLAWEKRAAVTATEAEKLSREAFEELHVVKLEEPAAQ